MGAARPGIVVVIIISMLVLGGITGGAAGEAGPFAAATQVDADSVLLRATLDDDGSATWLIRHRVTLDDENTTEAFESLQDDIRQNRSSFEDRFEEQMRSTIQVAENATGRDMGLSNVSVSTGTTPSGDGLIQYSLEWEGFAVVENERIVAGDAIAGLYLDSTQTLQFQWPDAYGVSSVTPNADELRQGVAVWHGRLAFGSDEPRLVLSTQAGSGTTADGVTTTGDDGTTNSPVTSATDRDESMLPFLAGGLAAFLVLAALAWVAVRRRPGGLPGAFSTPVGGSRDNSPPGGGQARDDGASGSPDGAATPPEELLSNEERVLRLLEERGGRMKQQDIVSELDWTDAKTSQVVGSLREEDQIEVFRIGRENVLALPGESDL